MCRYFYPGEYTEYKVKPYFVKKFSTLQCLAKLNGSISSTVWFVQPSASYEDSLRAAATTTFILLLDMTHRDALPSFSYLHIFGPISSILFGLSADALCTIAFCVDCPVHLSIEGTSVVKTDSEGWTVFLGRRIVLPSLECRRRTETKTEPVW